MRVPPDLVRVEGEATLTAAMRALTFPTTRRDALERVGGWPLMDDGEGARLTIGDLFSGMSDNTFHDRARAAKEADRRFTAVARSLEAVERARSPR